MDKLAELQHQINDLNLEAALLAALVFGDDHTAGRTFRDIAAQIREDQRRLAELQAALDELRSTFICKACRQRLKNTEENRLAHVATCAPRAAQEPLAQQYAAQLADLLGILAEVPGDDLRGKAIAAAVSWSSSQASQEAVING